MTSAGNTQAATWPLPKFYFSVNFGEETVVFQDVSGLETETRTIEYRHGDSPVFYPLKMPGLGRVGNVVLHKGIFVGDSRLWDWYAEIRMNVIARRQVTIGLLDETAAARMVWTLSNAWPTKLLGTDLNSDGNEVAIETLELAFETMSVTVP